MTIFPSLKNNNLTEGHANPTSWPPVLTILCQLAVQKKITKNKMKVQNSKTHSNQDFQMSDSGCMELTESFFVLSLPSWFVCMSVICRSFSGASETTRMERIYNEIDHNQ